MAATPADQTVTIVWGHIPRLEAERTVLRSLAYNGAVAAFGAAGTSVTAIFIRSDLHATTREGTQADAPHLTVNVRHSGLPAGYHRTAHVYASSVEWTHARPGETRPDEYGPKVGRGTFDSWPAEASMREWTAEKEEAVRNKGARMRTGSWRGCSPARGKGEKETGKTFRVERWIVEEGELRCFEWEQERRGRSGSAASSRSNSPGEGSGGEGPADGWKRDYLGLNSRGCGEGRGHRGIFTGCTGGVDKERKIRGMWR